MPLESWGAPACGHLTELGRLLATDVDELINGWSELVINERPPRQRVSPRHLRSELSEFLRQLFEHWIHPEPSLPRMDCLAALQHGEDRWRNGWQLADVVRDFELLRIVIIERLHHRLKRPLSLPEFVEIGRSLDQAITASVISYVGAREAFQSTAEERVGSITSHVVDGIITIDEDGVIQSFNAAAERLFGYSAESVIGQSVKILMPEPYCLQQDSQIGESLRNGRTKIVGVGREVVGQRANATTFPLDLSVSEFSNGTRRYYTGIVRDITERKKADTALRSHNESLELRVAERSRIAEQRALQLRALAAELTQAEQRERRRLAGELHDYLAQLLVACTMKTGLMRRHVKDQELRELLQEIDDMLNQSLIYTRTLIAELSPTILYEAGLVAALYWLAQQMQRHELEVEVECNVERVNLPDDKAILIFQSVRELLFNVLKHAGVKQVLVRGTAALEELQVSVIDSGRGFDQETRQSLPARGHFGLFSIRERIDALGGRFEIRSTRGRGTTATLTVPLNTIVAAERVSDAPSDNALPVADPSIGHRKTPRSRIGILIVDDQDLARKTLRTVLEAEPSMEVLGEACNGEEAVAAARQLSPDVVLMDVNLPIMNGLEATRMIKRDRPETHVLGFSVHNDKELAAAMQHVGAAGYLLKGVSADEIRKAIFQAVGTPG